MCMSSTGPGTKNALENGSEVSIARSMSSSSKVSMLHAHTSLHHRRNLASIPSNLCTLLYFSVRLCKFDPYPHVVTLLVPFYNNLSMTYVHSVRC